ncbi:hypothetical protein HNV10_12970 [Winogradskyella litoriviva]|uniref:Adhesin domain-containing protein n=1 Tax=Winogradskyella litoriviva TaxID=1220182 RepID=A0ABX2E6Z3_9FLAO|nr:hypothetical protein [Winogradskyella litoriviva]NRD24165.1 hypothetical protein [Winogradskyella litoriviva]
MKKIRILVLCLITTLGYAQKKLSKTSQSINVNKDVVVDLNTSYVEIQLETWNKNTVEVEAYIESEKLTKEELKHALESWNLKIEGSNDKVTISSSGGSRFGVVDASEYPSLIKELEYQLIEMPELPELPEFPELPEMVNMPKMPELPDMPVMPKLPELPKGVTTIEFDYEKYQKDGENYLAEWSKKYEKKGGKEFQKKMEDWARKFGESGYQEKMEKWGKEYAERFDGKWTKEMEKWGEKFGEKYGKDMEKWGEEFGERFGEEWEEKMAIWGERFSNEMDERSEALEQRKEALKNRKETLYKENEARRKALEARRDELNNRRDVRVIQRLESGTNSKVKKVLKIKIPKKAKLKTNIRHGELKLSSVIYNMKGDISHSFLLAEHIDGGDTSINVSYSPVVIDTWSLGTLNLNFVNKAQITNGNNLVLNSKSSNINIENLTDTGIIDGSFGDLTISNLSQTFKNLNLVLENSDALVNLPDNLYYTLYFKGNRSKLNNKTTEQKTIRNYPNGESSNRSIVINAKYSDVIIN